MTIAPRFECKYCVPVAEAEGVLRVARVFLDVDRVAWPDQAPGAPVPVQQITSLYLDSPARTFLAWHLARRPARFKLRIRRYSAGRDDVAWAEVKHKVDNRVTKTRGLLPLRSVADIERSPCGAATAAGSDAALDDFLARQTAFSASPQALLRCDRHALRGVGIDRSVGVTVDTEVRYQAGPRCSLADVPEREWLPLPLTLPGRDPGAIVELKHGGRPPAWMRHMMTRLAPWQCSYSKYVAAMQAGVLAERGRP
jgi:hypothetical protein